MQTRTMARSFSVQVMVSSAIAGSATLACCIVTGIFSALFVSSNTNSLDQTRNYQIAADQVTIHEIQEDTDGFWAWVSSGRYSWVDTCVGIFVGFIISQWLLSRQKKRHAHRLEAPKASAQVSLSRKWTRGHRHRRPRSPLSSPSRPAPSSTHETLFPFLFELPKRRPALVLPPGRSRLSLPGPHPIPSRVRWCPGWIRRLLTAQVAEALLPALPVALCEMAVPKVLTLDIPEAQVAVEFPNDLHVRFHHRVLLVDLGQGKHVAVTPDEEVESLDLNAHRIVSLLRSAPFPTRIENDVYTFDPISADTLERLRLEARTMARVLGASASSCLPVAS